ncbi:MAG: glycosyltransferase family 2 protein [Moorea sp. SIO2I5]|nr:glycosyltransferase family 2 protein [Moorena sp. SIO2I5]
MQKLKVSIMITTRNRLTDLQGTCDVITRLEPPPHEVLVTADGCTDGTVEYLKANHPDFRLTINEQGRGSVASRAAMMQQATGDLVLALDDDSYPEQLNCLDTLAQIFAKHPKLAIATFPQRTDEYPETLTQQDFGSPTPVRSFANSGACLRVSTYRSLPGFEPMFFHAYEEPDYAIQCIANDWQIHYFPEITIRHHYSLVRRNEIRTHHLHARNEFWSVMMRCPAPYCIPLALYRILSQARYALSRGPQWLVQEPKWWWQALTALPQALKRRQPLPWDGYLAWLQHP